MKLKYNSPTILTFTFISVAVLALDQFLFPNLIKGWFSVPGRGDFHFGIRNVVNLFTHVIGHADWPHLVGNFSIILLVGPMLEMRYGSKDMILMMVITALATGLLNVLFFMTGLFGASGVVFMMILLASFTNFKKGEIPLTFILVLFLYLGQQIIEAFQHDNISQFTHIAGGVLGSLFGFWGRREEKDHEQR
ncbi:MAG: rhomboid family intramembrane serine protease [Treponema sp.]|jgi:membrane associated rhomboid family serine protease|nr:rhomboid family intramembrane serine protease [Treponema sp.]